MDNITVVGHSYRFLMLVRFVGRVAWLRLTYLDGHQFIVSRTFCSRRALESIVLVSMSLPAISMAFLTATSLMATSGTTVMILVVLAFATIDQVATVARGI